MNRFDIRHWRTLATLAAGGLLGTVALTGCSSGQLSQTASQASAVNGAQTAINDMLLRNVHLQAVQTGDFLQTGHTVDLVLVVTNNSPDVADKLLGITTDIGTVALSDAPVPAGGFLFIGKAEGQNQKAGAVEAAKYANAAVALTKAITNGLTYSFTFNFEKAGSGSLRVPISAPPASSQSETPAPAEHH
ncbi:MAG: hypothetical protein ACRDTV_22850 [Mycobacterium sp.]